LSLEEKPALPADQLSLKEVKAKLRTSLPRNVFEQQPWRGVLALVIVASYLALGACVVVFDPAWPLKLLAGLLIGQGITGSSLIGHEVLHGAVFRSRFWQDLVGGIVYAPYGISASFWRVWHVQPHHGHTNIAGDDPDCIGFYDQFREDRVFAAFAGALPGGRNLLMPLSAFVAFTAQAMLVLWHLAPKLGVARREIWRMRAVCLLLVAAQVALGVWLGAANAFFLLLVPQLVANATLISYIATQHWLEPLGRVNDPLHNTASVKTFSVFDYMHGWFSYHQEHHLFPSMNPIFARQVRAALLELQPQQVKVLPHLEALRWVHRSPRTYGQNDELLDATRRFALSDIKAAIAATQDG
jgi:fatty acid desaturase